MDMDVAVELARLAVQQHKVDTERYEAVFRVDKAKVKAIMRLSAERVAEIIMGEANLTTDERDVIRLHVRREMSQEDAAEELHIAVKSLQRLYKAAIDKLILYLTYLTMIYRAANEGA